MDLKIMALEKKGKLVPTRDMIKTPEQIESERVVQLIQAAWMLSLRLSTQE